MNTYPAFYPNFGTTNTTTNAYSNPYSPPYGYNQQAPQMTQFSVPQSQPPMMTVIGKAVENKDMVSVADVPAGCCSQISVRNTSTQTVTVQNANLIIERVA